MRKAMLTVGLLVSVGSVGADGFMPWTDVFAKFDKNKDGSITMEEAGDKELGKQFPGFDPFMKDHFAELDANHDGKVSREEFEAMMHSKKWDDKAMANQFYKNTGFMATNPENQK